MPKPRPIENEVQLLVEGNDQRNFFEAFLEHLHIDGVQIQNFGGVSELDGFLGALVNARLFETVDRVGIVRDADESPKGACQSVETALSKAALRVPGGQSAHERPRVSVLILPGRGREGELETLLCETIENTRMEHCIDEFFACVEGLPGSAARSAKATAMAYQATRQDPYRSVGVAAKHGDWDLDHSAFDDVRCFLNELR